MTKNISVRELFLKIMNFEPCDRTLNWELAYWGGTLKRWYEEGLPKIKGLPDGVTHGKGIGGPARIVGQSWGAQTPLWDYDVSSHFNLDEGFNLAPYYYWIFPFFDKEVISEDKTHLEIIDSDGIRKKVLKDDSSMPFFIEWPVRNRNDWEKVKEERFNLDTINNRWVSDREKYTEEIKNDNKPRLILDAPLGFFGSLRELIGAEKLFLLFYDDPKLIHDILDHLCDLWISMAEELTSSIDFDMAVFWEDMAGKQGPLISPSTFREFQIPRYKKIINFLKSKGVEHFLVDTDGKTEELIHLFLEVGINTIIPFEQQADNDLNDIRKKYPDLRIFGGFDKNALYKGREFIDKELEKMPYLISKGGFIPFADHDIPPNSPWENFNYYRHKLNDIVYSTKVLGKTTI